MPKVLSQTDGKPDASRVYTFRLLNRQLDKLQTIARLRGVPVAEQIRRGVDLWIEKQGR